MILYGWGTKIIKMQFIGKYFCLDCGGFTDYHVVREVFRITIFFIPVFWHTKHYYIMCDSCQKGNEITKEYAERLFKEFANMYSPAKLDKIIDDTVAILKENSAHEPNCILNQIKNKYELPFENTYMEGLIETVCDLYKGKEHV